MPNRKSTYVITLLVIAFGFLLFSLFVYFFPDSPLDIEFTEEIQEHQNHFMDWLMKFVSWFGYMPWSAVMVFATAGAFMLFKYKREALFILLTMISGLVSSLLKVIVNRPRPSQDLVRIIEKAKHQSFPSGHVVFYVTFFGMLVLIMWHHKTFAKPLRACTIAISLFFMFTVLLSRVYLGAHWFTDVTAGFIAGLFCLAALGYFYLVKKGTATRSV